MNKRNETLIFICLFFSILNSYSSDKKMGITRIYIKSNIISNEYRLQIEDLIISAFADVRVYTPLSLNTKLNEQGLKELMKQKFIPDEFKDLELLLIPEILFFSAKEEKDFYDSLLINYRIRLNLKITLVDLKKNYQLIDEEHVELNILSKISFEDAQSEMQKEIRRKLERYVLDLNILKEKIEILKTDKNFIWLSKGIDSDLKTGNILCYYDTSEHSTREHTLIQIIRVFSDKSLAIIIFKNGEIPEDGYFVKKNKTNLEIQLAGGFSLGDMKTSLMSTNPNANIRLILPVGLVFFNPLFEIEANFFYKNSKLLLPFSFLTGVEGKFNIYRYEITAGFLTGIFFSPNTDYVYNLDCAVIKPYIRNKVTLNGLFNLFFEFGYKYYIEDNFSKEWKIDLDGLYFLFGFGITF